MFHYYCRTQFCFAVSICFYGDLPHIFTIFTALPWWSSWFAPRLAANETAHRLELAKRKIDEPTIEYVASPRWHRNQRRRKTLRISMCFLFLILFLGFTSWCWAWIINVFLDTWHACTVWYQPCGLSCQFGWGSFQPVFAEHARGLV